ncbi:MAG: aminodeoxychorismate lyase [Woeseiaceae bacterium]|nr:aminodeoxychorismate lyase [Woeseiaceae bacterium]
MSEWFRNGQAVHGIAPSDRGFRYGDGLFETIAIRGGKPRLWDLHAARLARGLRTLGIGGVSTETCRQQVSSALLATGIDIDRAAARLVVTAGTGARGYARPATQQPDIVVEIAESPPLADAIYEQGIVTRRCDTPLSWQPALAGLKTLNRLDQVLARREWQDETVFEGLMCDRDGHVICGTMSNVFIIADNEVRTPRLAHAGVAGVMRQQVIDLLAQSGRPAVEDDIGWAELETADEVFVCNSQFGAIPVRRCDSREWPVGDRVREVRAALRDAGVAEGPV